MRAGDLSSDAIPKKYGPGTEADYHECLERAACLYCGELLRWRLGTSSGSDDRFCMAECCEKRYSMVPSKVKIIETDISLIEMATAVDVRNSITDDADFTKELERLSCCPRCGYNAAWDGVKCQNCGHLESFDRAQDSAFSPVKL